MSTAGPIVIRISGRPGAGKTTLTACLRDALVEDYAIAVLSDGSDPDTTLADLTANAPELEVVLVDGLGIDTKPDNVFTLHLLDAPTAVGINIGSDRGIVTSDAFVLTAIDREAELRRPLVRIRRDARLLRSGRPTFLVSSTVGTGLSSVIGWIEDRVDGHSAVDTPAGE